MIEKESCKAYVWTRLYFRHLGRFLLEEAWLLWMESSLDCYIAYFYAEGALRPSYSDLKGRARLSGRLGLFIWTCA